MFFITAGGTGGVPKENGSVSASLFHQRISHLLTLNQRKRARGSAPSHNALLSNPQLPEGNDHSRKEAIFHKEQKQRAHFIISSDRTEKPIKELSDHRRACSQNPNGASSAPVGPGDGARVERLKIENTSAPPVGKVTPQAAREQFDSCAASRRTSERSKKNLPDVPEDQSQQRRFQQVRVDPPASVFDPTLTLDQTSAEQKPGPEREGRARPGPGGTAAAQSQIRNDEICSVSPERRSSETYKQPTGDTLAITPTCIYLFLQKHLPPSLPRAPPPAPRD